MITNPYISLLLLVALVAKKKKLLLNKKLFQIEEIVTKENFAERQDVSSTRPDDEHDEPKGDHMNMMNPQMMMNFAMNAGQIYQANDELKREMEKKAATISKLSIALS